MTGRRANHQENSRQFRVLTVLAALSALVYGRIAFLSWQFKFESPTAERPIVAVLCLFVAAFAAYLVSIRFAARAPQTPRLLAVIIWPAIVFRVTMLFSVPIQEIDIYRYLWDGEASTAGVSPFHYSPAQVRAATADAATDGDLLKLVRIRDQHPASAEVLRRVHFGELPTIYPPTSQFVFAAASLTTPADAPVPARVFVMKAWFVAFDLATLFVVVALLKQCRLPVGLCVIYAWCPLLMKEVANSGHLDTVAVFLTTLAVYLAARLLAKPGARTQDADLEPRKPPGTGSFCGVFGAKCACPPLFRRLSDRFSAGETIWRNTVQTTLVFVVLALAIGAKLYPIVLAPLFVLVLARHLGWRRLLIPTAVFAVTTCLLLTPMLPNKSSNSPERGAAADDPPLPVAAQVTNTDPSQGVTTFLRHWEMNDFIFLVVIENLKPSEQLSTQQRAWFSVVPNSARQQLVQTISERFNVAPAEVPFHVTRALTAIAFLIVAIWLAWRAARNLSLIGFCEAGFLTIAWFWLLCPTQNPWYWTWALPLLAFARGRAWLAVSGLVLLYYLRFWLVYHWPETTVLGTSYVGYAFFDFVVTWFEFAPWFAWLSAAAFLRLWRTKRGRECFSVIAFPHSFARCPKKTPDPRAQNFLSARENSG